MSNGLNLLHQRKDVAEMVIVFCVSLIVPEDLMFAIKSGEHVYQESSFFVSPLSFLRVSWWYQVSMSWCNCSKMSEVLAGAHMIFVHLHWNMHFMVVASLLLPRIKRKNRKKNECCYHSAKEWAKHFIKVNQEPQRQIIYHVQYIVSKTWETSSIPCMFNIKKMQRMWWFFVETLIRFDGATMCNLPIAPSYR